jgi:hypothetical protein
MKICYHPLKILIISAVFLSYCRTMKNSAEKLFIIKDAYYQSWIINENEKGTNIIIEITNMQPGIIFDSIVFRHTRLPASYQEKDGVIYLKSVLYIGLSQLTSKNVTVSSPDMILFRYNGTNQSYILKEIRRLKTKYY